MTPTTNERDRFEAWAKDTMSLVKEPGGYKEATTHHAWRAWQAALTREQREGVVTFAVDDVRFDVPASIAEKVAAKLAPADNLPQPEMPGAGCVCGNPEAPYTVHRTDGPCYQQEAPGAVACWRLVSRFGVCSVWLTGDISADAARQAIADGNRVERAYTTPPAPVDVDVRVAELIAADREYDEANAAWSGESYEVDSYGVEGSNFLRCLSCGQESGAGILNKGVAHEAGCKVARFEAAEKRRAAALALLSGQQAGVDSTGDSPEDHACFIEACADTFAQTGRPTTARTLREAATELRRLAALGGGGGGG